MDDREKYDKIRQKRIRTKMKMDGIPKLSLAYLYCINGIFIPIFERRLS
jgi:hypothetical protein